MKLVQTFLKIPVKTVDSESTELQLLLKEKELREEWSNGRKRWHPKNFRIVGRKNPWG